MGFPELGETITLLGWVAGLIEAETDPGGIEQTVALYELPYAIYSPAGRPTAAEMLVPAAFDVSSSMAVFN
jgi:hypothetical protein